MDIIQALQNIGVLPTPRCLLCLEAARATMLCTNCLERLPWLTEACYQCALPLPTAGLCGHCTQRDYPFTVQGLFVYAWPINRFLAQLKYQEDLSFARFFAQLMCQHLPHPPAGTVVLPVPMATPNLKKRGFNQTAEMAKVVAKQLGLPLQLTAVQKTRTSIRQSELSSHARQRNLKSSDFNVDPHFAPKSVLIIEDVMTTGATLKALSQALWAKGVKAIHVWVVARTPKGEG